MSFSHCSKRYSVDESGSHVTRTRKIEEVKLRHESEIKALKARFAQDQVSRIDRGKNRVQRVYYYMIDYGVVVVVGTKSE